MKKLVAFALLVTVVCVGVFTFSASQNKVSAHAYTTCQMAAWYKVKGPHFSAGPNGSSENQWLYEYKDIQSGAFCGLLHSSIDYTASSPCVTFFTAVHSNGGTEGGTTHTACIANTSGSLQSSFYRPTVRDYWSGEGYFQFFNLDVGYTAPIIVP